MNIGVGSGYLEEIIKQAGWEIYSPDPNEKTINRLNEEGMKGYIGYIEHIPFHDEMFDIVVASELLEHLDDKQRLMGLSEIVRILKRGGLFIGTVRYKETLVDNEAVCPKCGEKFHRWGRKKSFNINELRKELSSFFVITELKRTVFRNTGINYVVRDLLMVKNLVGARLSDVSLDLVGYFMCDYRELLMMEKLGSQVDVRALYAQWWEGIQMLTPDQQKLIKEYVNELQKQRASFTGLRRLVVRLGLDSLYHSIVGAMRHIRHRLAGKPVYADVLEAAMQTDHILTGAFGSEQQKG